jgi:hypothetical protein
MGIGMPISHRSNPRPMGNAPSLVSEKANATDPGNVPALPNAKDIFKSRRLRARPEVFPRDIAPQS